MDGQNYRTLFDSYNENNLKYWVLDIGHMLLFGVIAMTFLWEGLDIWVGWIFPPCNMASQIQGAVY